MVADRPHVGRLAFRPRLHLAAGPLHFDRIVRGRRFLTRGDGEQMGNLFGLHRALVAGDAIELLEQFRRLEYGRFFPLDLDRVVAGRHTHTERRTNATQVLVSRTKDRQQPFGVDNRDGRAGHRSPRRRWVADGLERCGMTELKYTRSPGTAPGSAKFPQKPTVFSGRRPRGARPPGRRRGANRRGRARPRGRRGSGLNPWPPPLA